MLLQYASHVSPHTDPPSTAAWAQCSDGFEFAGKPEWYNRHWRLLPPKALPLSSGYAEHVDMHVARSVNSLPQLTSMLLQ
jgi:hypothetical protein